MKNELYATIKMALFKDTDRTMEEILKFLELLNFAKRVTFETPDGLITYNIGCVEEVELDEFIDNRKVTSSAATEQVTPVE